MIFICPYKKSHGREIDLMVAGLNKYSTEKLTIYVVGDDPLIKSVNHIPFKSLHNTKEARVAEKLIHAINEIKPNEFILINDDMFPVKSFDPNKLPLWHNDSIAKMIKRFSPQNIYRKTLENSLVNQNDISFAVHYPMPIYNVPLFVECLEKTISDKQNSFRNLYGNKMANAHELRYTPDCKIFSPGKPDVFDSFIKNGFDWISIGDRYWTIKNRAHVWNYVLNN